MASEFVRSNCNHFCEKGLVFAPFPPGDSLLFLLCFLAAGEGLKVWIIIFILSVAAILGDSVNYRIGTSFGNWLIHREKCLVDRRHIDMTRQYYHRYGKKTIILARFVPGIRSFAPFVASATSLHRFRYSKSTRTGSSGESS